MALSATQLAVSEPARQAQGDEAAAPQQGPKQPVVGGAHAGQGAFPQAPPADGERGAGQARDDQALQPAQKHDHAATTTPGRKKLAPQTTSARAFTVVVLLAALPLAAKVWLDDPDYSLGPLVLGWVVWTVWRRSAHATPATAARAPAWPAGAALVAVAAGWYFASAPLAVLGVAAALVGLGLQVGTWNGLRVPALALLLTVPPPGSDAVLVWLQGFVAAATGAALNLLGIATTRDVLALHTQHNTYLVAPLCSGLASVLAVLALLAIAGHQVGTRPGRLAVVLAVGCALTMALNVLRIVLLVVLTERSGPTVIAGTGHQAIGIVLSLAAIAACLPLLRPRRRPA